MTWGFQGENSSFMGRIMGVFMNMDKAIGKDFEEGLSNLRGILENESGQDTTEEE